MGTITWNTSPGQASLHSKMKEWGPACYSACQAPIPPFLTPQPADQAWSYPLVPKSKCTKQSLSALASRHKQSRICTHAVGCHAALWAAVCKSEQDNSAYIQPWMLAGLRARAATASVQIRVHSSGPWFASPLLPCDAILCNQHQSLRPKAGSMACEAAWEPTSADAFKNDKVMPLLVLLVSRDDPVQHVIPVADCQQFDGLLG